MADTEIARRRSAGADLIAGSRVRQQHSDQPGARTTCARTSALDAIPPEIELPVFRLGAGLEENIVPCRPAPGHQFHRVNRSFRDLAHLQAPALASHAEAVWQTTGDYGRAVPSTVTHGVGGLSAGELNFICSIRLSLKHSGQATPKQAKWLENTTEGSQQSGPEKAEEVA